MRALAHQLPQAISAPLFGDRRQFGLAVKEDDPDWIAWVRVVESFYEATQRGSIGEKVNKLGYTVMRRIDLTGKAVLEIGPGALDHLQYCTGKPACFHLADVRETFLDFAAAKLDAAGIAYQRHLIPSRDSGLPFADDSLDVITTFYSLEHLHPFEKHLREMVRVLRPGGTFIGAIPCEGGLAWGLGRFLTSRPWLMSRGVNMDKIICWEHPNFSDTILNALDKALTRKHVSLAPFGVPILDANLVARFVYQKPL